jgi:hypothetical protein
VPTTFLNAAIHSETGLTEMETRFFSAIISRGPQLVAGEDFLKYVKAMKSLELQRTVLIRAVGPEVTAEILDGGKVPAALLPRSCGFLGTTFECASAAWHIGAGNSSSTRVITILRRLDDINRKGIKLSPLAGPTPFQDHFACIAETLRGGEDYQIFFLFIASLIHINGTQQTERSAGGCPKPIEPTAIPPHISAWAFKMSLQAGLGAIQDQIINQIRDLMRSEDHTKRQRTTSPQALGGHQSASSSVSTASLPSGITPGKVFRHCFDFNRPKGCNRQGCSRDHILIRCLYYPACSSDADTCKFHHG